MFLLLYLELELSLKPSLKVTQIFTRPIFYFLALYSFPYVKKRIPVFSKSVQVLSPIEVAIDEMQTRIAELEEVVRMQPTDLKKLQLKLQGSISVQVCNFDFYILSFKISY